MNHHFRAKFLLVENQMSRFTIQHLVNTCETKKIKIVVTILRYHGNKKSAISGYTLHVIWKAVYLLSATVHINSVYKLEIIHIKSSNANQKLILGFEFLLL